MRCVLSDFAGLSNEDSREASNFKHRLLVLVKNVIVRDWLRPAQFAQGLLKADDVKLQLLVQSMHLDVLRKQHVALSP